MTEYQNNDEQLQFISSAMVDIIIVVDQYNSEEVDITNGFAPCMSDKRYARGCHALYRTTT